MKRPRSCELYSKRLLADEYNFNNNKKWKSILTRPFYTVIVHAFLLRLFIFLFVFFFYPLAKPRSDERKMKFPFTSRQLVLTSTRQTFMHPIEGGAPPRADPAPSSSVHCNHRRNLFIADVMHACIRKICICNAYDRFCFFSSCSLQSNVY